jgi:hypothetical protein
MEINYGLLEWDSEYTIWYTSINISEQPAEFSALKVRRASSSKNITEKQHNMLHYRNH